MAAASPPPSLQFLQTRSSLLPQGHGPLFSAFMCLQAFEGVLSGSLGVDSHALASRWGSGSSMPTTCTLGMPYPSTSSLGSLPCCSEVQEVRSPHLPEMAACSPSLRPGNQHSSADILGLPPSPPNALPSRLLESYTLNRRQPTPGSVQHHVSTTCRVRAQREAGHCGQCTLVPKDGLLHLQGRRSQIPQGTKGRRAARAREA